MLRILGVIDILGALILLAIAREVEIPLVVLVIIPLILFLKALPFLLQFDIGSIFDIIAVILIVLNVFISIPAGVFYGFSAYLGIKGLISLF